MPTQSLDRLAGVLQSAYSVTRLNGETDGALLDRCQTGNDSVAFEQLVRRHGSKVLAACRKVLPDSADVDDAFQATFLVLLQKPRSVRKKESVGAWLFGVAHRVAVRARDSAARRRRLLKKAARASDEATAIADLSWRDACAILHNELDKLPDTLRLPLILCYLNGLSRDEAAEQLGRTPGSVKSGLQKGREQLRKRLLRRGVTLSAGLLTAVADSIEAATPAALVRTTVESASKPTLAVSTLARFISPAPSFAAVKTVGACIAAGILAVGLALGVPGDPKSDAPPKKDSVGKESVGKDVPAKVPANKGIPKNDGLIVPDSFAYSGKVFGSDGKPVKGAKVWMYTPGTRSTPLTMRAMSDADGKFSFTVKRIEFPGSDDHRFVQPMYNGAIVATLTGSGPGWQMSPMPAAAQSREIGVLVPTLRLATDDVPIEGRILDLQGKPIAGATARVIGLYRPNEVDLGQFHKTLVAERHSRHVIFHHLTGIEEYELRHGQLDVVVPPAKSGGDGRFILRGVGRERVAIVRIEGESIETRDVFVMTRPSETLTVNQYKEEDAQFPLSRHTYYGCKFDHAAAPSRPVFGVVREAGTGRPVPGATVACEHVGGSIESDPLRCVTVADDRGRFKLVGVPAKPGCRLVAIAPIAEALVRNSAEIPQPPGLGPISLDLEMPRGVWVSGRVVDRDTNKPVRAEIHYFAFDENPHARAAPDFRTDPSVRARLDDGSFRLVALPGKGIVAIKIHQGNDQFVVDIVNQDKMPVMIGAKPLNFQPGEFLTHKVVEPVRDAKEVTCDFFLSTGSTVKGTVVGPDGKRLRDVFVAGENPWNLLTWRQGDGAFSATGLTRGNSRYIQAIDEKNQLAGVTKVSGAEKGPVELKLEPWGVLTGRLLNNLGEPLADSSVTFTWENVPADNVKLKIGFVHKGYYKTDKEGRFKIDGLVPGMNYNVVSVSASEIRGYVARLVSVKSGETKDLGDVRLKQVHEVCRELNLAGRPKRGATESKRAFVGTVGLLIAQYACGHPATRPFRQRLFSTSPTSPGAGVVGIRFDYSPCGCGTDYFAGNGPSEPGTTLVRFSLKIDGHR